MDPSEKHLSINSNIGIQDVPEDAVLLSDDFRSSCVTPKFQRSQMNYHKSRINLLPVEEQKLSESMEREISKEEEALQQKISAYTQFIDCFGYAEWRRSA